MIISEVAAYNIFLQLKSCEETLGDEGDSDYVTRSKPCKGKVLCNTIYSVEIVMLDLKIQ